MYENFVGTWETVRNREVSVLERCPHGENIILETFRKNIAVSRYLVHFLALVSFALPVNGFNC